MELLWSFDDDALTVDQEHQYLEGRDFVLDIAIKLIFLVGKLKE
jgi:hypothetical protein